MIDVVIVELLLSSSKVNVLLSLKRFLLESVLCGLCGFRVAFYD